MPTIILLDVSLSMIKPAFLPSDGTTIGDDEITRRDLAQTGLNHLFDYIAAHDKMEFTALVIYSSLYEVVVPFTRDYGELKVRLGSTQILID